jgi:aryl-alcohol dehydrogenase-like predicted oxidoreductase
MSTTEGHGMAMTFRPLGRWDEEVSAIGIGGYHIGKPEDPETGVEIVRHALDGGITFLDNSWDYHEGESERRMGRALRDGYRDRAFLMTKLDSHSRDGAMRQFGQSLERLETDHVDLLQLHEVIRYEDPDRALAPGGSIEALLELKQQGAARYIGFTGHKDPKIHLRMLRKAMERGIIFDTIQMPINPFDADHERSFTQRVLPECLENGIAAIGMKPIGSGAFIGATSLTPVDLLRWALSQPLSVLVTGCESIADVDQAIDVASGFTPLSAAEQLAITQEARSVSADGHLESYKTETVHDSTSAHPEWLE